MENSSPDPKYCCRVCGLEQPEPPWGEDGESPTYDYCDCCGVEFGNQDYTVESTRAYRAEWLRRGAPWARPEAKPPDWDLERQLAQIPPEFR